MLGLFSVDGVVVAGYTGSGFALCLGSFWVLQRRDTLEKRGKNKRQKNKGVTCKIADISS